MNKGKYVLEFPYRVEDLLIGMFIRIRKEHWKLHPFALPAFLISSQDEIEILKESPIQEVLVDPIKSTISFTSEGKPVLRTHSPLPQKVVTVDEETPLLSPAHSPIQKRLSMLRDFSESHAKRIETIRETESLIISQGKSDDVFSALDSFASNSLEVLSKYCEDESKDLSLSVINSPSNKIPYLHGANVEVLCLMLAIMVGYKNPEQLKDILLGAAFHDIGYWKLPRNMQKTWRPHYRRGEARARQQHVEHGVKLLEECGAFSQDVLSMVKHHHESFNGKGFYKVAGEDIHPYARILIICDFYDRMINNSEILKRQTPHDTLSRMYSLYRAMFDPEILRLFIKMLGVYPAGSVVRLTNGSLASVIKVFNDEILNPEVIVYDPSIRAADAIFYRVSDLGKDVKIESAVNAQELPADVRSYLNVTDTLAFRLG